MSEEEFLAKINYEGGIIEALEYGLRAQDLEDRTSKLYFYWRDLTSWWTSWWTEGRAVRQNMEDYLEEHGEEM